MTFEEFFKRKKIDLAQLQSGEPGLFTEFKNHYEQMGEKSFDHTKKYWFNQLRRRFVPAPEIKAEKIHIENQLAEQTITEALTEPATPAPSVGFKPQFKTAMAPKPAEEIPQEQPAPSAYKPAETPAPAVDFKPRFKASMVTKPAEETPVDDPAAIGDKPEEAPTPAVGFKPRFKASMVPKTTGEKPADEPAKSEDKPAEAATPSVGFKPRFKASMVAKPTEEKTEPEVEAIADQTVQPAPPEEKKEEPTENKPEEAIAKPVGFKPRFNAAKMKPKEPGTE